MTVPREQSFGCLGGAGGRGRGQATICSINGQTEQHAAWGRAGVTRKVSEIYKNGLLEVLAEDCLVRRIQKAHHEADVHSHSGHPGISPA